MVPRDARGAVAFASGPSLFNCGRWGRSRCRTSSWGCRRWPCCSIAAPRARGRSPARARTPSGAEAPRGSRWAPSCWCSSRRPRSPTSRAPAWGGSARSLSLLPLLLALASVEREAHARVVVRGLMVMGALLATFGLLQIVAGDAGVELGRRTAGPFSHYQTFAGVVLLCAALRVHPGGVWRLAHPRWGRRRLRLERRGDRRHGAAGGRAVAQSHPRLLGGARWHGGVRARDAPAATPAVGGAGGDRAGALLTAGRARARRLDLRPARRVELRPPLHARRRPAHGGGASAARAGAGRGRDPLSALSPSHRPARPSAAPARLLSAAGRRVRGAGPGGVRLHPDRELRPGAAQLSP